MLGWAAGRRHGRRLCCLLVHDEVPSVPPGEALHLLCRQLLVAVGHGREHPEDVHTRAHPRTHVHLQEEKEDTQADLMGRQSY